MRRVDLRRKPPQGVPVRARRVETRRYSDRAEYASRAARARARGYVGPGAIARYRADLAAALGISQGEVSRLERAVYAVSVERFVAWCAACGHSSSYVLERAQHAARTMPATVTTYRKARAWRELA